MAQAAQLIRGKNLEIFRPYNSGLSARDAITETAKAGKVMASTLRMCKALVETNDWRYMRDVFRCWTGTMTAYVEPEKAFNESKMFSKELQAIVYTDPKIEERWIFPVEDYGSEKNAILVSEHPDYSLEIDGKEILVKPKVVDIVFNFPEKDGWYLRDAKRGRPRPKKYGWFRGVKHGIPTGVRRISRRQWKTIYLSRIYDAGRIGPVARDCIDAGLNYTHKRHILLDVRPSDLLGVVVEAQ
jgi:hypothetical protein